MGRPNSFALRNGRTWCGSSSTAAFRAFLAGLALAVVCSQVCSFVSQPLPSQTSLRPRAAISSRTRLRAEDEAAAEELAEEEKPAPKKILKIKRIVKDYGINLDGDDLSNLEEWYQEPLDGEGGQPPVGSLFMDLILRSFSEPFADGNGCLKPFYVFGEGTATPKERDFEIAYENFVKGATETVRLGRLKMMVKSEYKRTDWLWLVGRQSPAGIFLKWSLTPPYGERALAVLKPDDINEFLNKVDWYRLLIRLHKHQLWGGLAIKFPYPVGRLASLGRL